MFKEKIWLSSPTMHGEELKYMKEAYDTNWMSTVGENINIVEQKVAERIGTGYAVALASGTSALHLAIKYAGEKIYGKTENGKGALCGHKVFCSDMTFSATVNPVVYEGGEPVFIDTEYETWNMDPVALEKAFNLYKDVKLVVFAHLYGTPCKINAVREVCRKHGALIIEDAAESFGATYNGIETGTFGDFNAISFNGNKIITGSSGGMFLTDDKDAAEKVRKWSTQSREPVAWYQHEEIGYNYRMSNVIAGVVRGQLPYLDEHISQKKAIYERYKKGFEGLPVSMNPFNEEKSSPNYWLSCMIINKGHDVKPEKILKALADENAEGRPIWKPMHMQPVFKDNEFVSVEVPAAGEDIFSRGLCLPSDIKMKPEDQDEIINIIRNCFED